MTNQEKRDALKAFLEAHNMKAVCVINWEDDIGVLAALGEISKLDAKCVAFGLRVVTDQLNNYHAE